MQVPELAGLGDGPARGGDAGGSQKEGDQTREEVEREEVVAVRRALGEMGGESQNVRRTNGS